MSRTSTTPAKRPKGRPPKTKAPPPGNGVDPATPIPTPTAPAPPEASGSASPATPMPPSPAATARGTRTKHRQKPARAQVAAAVRPLPMRVEQVERHLLDQGQEVLTVGYCYPDAAGRAVRLIIGYKSMSIYLDRGGPQVTRVRWSELAHALAQVETLENSTR